MDVLGANRLRRVVCSKLWILNTGAQWHILPQAKGGGLEIGATKRGKGMKIMAIVDRHGLPLSVSTDAANHHEVRLVQLCFDFYMIEAKPENLIGDRAYDSDPLDAELRKDGIEMIAPHRSNRSKPPTQDRRRLSRYMRRWLVERFTPFRLTATTTWFCLVYGKRCDDWSIR